jgi:hypothetical protein
LRNRSTPRKASAVSVSLVTSKVFSTNTVLEVDVCNRERVTVSAVRFCSLPLCVPPRVTFPSPPELGR